MVSFPHGLRCWVFCVFHFYDAVSIVKYRFRSQRSLWNIPGGVSVHCEISLEESASTVKCPLVESASIVKYPWRSQRPLWNIPCGVNVHCEISLVESASIVKYPWWSQRPLWNIPGGVSVHCEISLEESASTVKCPLVESASIVKYPLRSQRPLWNIPCGVSVHCEISLVESASIVKYPWRSQRPLWKIWRSHIMWLVFLIRLFPQNQHWHVEEGEDVEVSRSLHFQEGHYLWWVSLSQTLLFSEHKSQLRSSEWRRIRLECYSHSSLWKIHLFSLSTRFKMEINHRKASSTSQ